jgi:hypothetical protein
MVGRRLETGTGTLRRATVSRKAAKRCLDFRLNARARDS